MAKKKRGGFSSLDNSRPKIQPVEKKSKPQNGILIVSVLSEGFLVKEKEDILSMVFNHIDRKFVSGTLYENHGAAESLYILLNIEMNTTDVIKDIQRRYKIVKGLIHVENKHRYIDSKDVEPITEAKKDIYEDDKGKVMPKLRIDLSLNKAEELFDFLKSKPINHQTRKRYSEPLSDITTITQKNDSNRSTFVAKNVAFDKDSVEVYVNGEVSTDVCCRVEEKDDAYILHLYYKDTKQYSKSILIAKEDAKEPLQRISYNEEDNAISVNGKKLSLTFEGYDAYRRHSCGNANSEKVDSPTIKYVGKPNRERKTAIIRQTKVETKEDIIHVQISEQPKDTDQSSTKNKFENSVEKVAQDIQQKEQEEAPSQKGESFEKDSESSQYLKETPYRRHSFFDWLWSKIRSLFIR